MLRVDFRRITIHVAPQSNAPGRRTHPVRNYFECIRLECILRHRGGSPTNTAPPMAVSSRCHSVMGSTSWRRPGSGPLCGMNPNGACQCACRCPFTLGLGLRAAQPAGAGLRRYSGAQNRRAGISMRARGVSTARCAYAAALGGRRQQPLHRAPGRAAGSHTCRYSRAIAGSARGTGHGGWAPHSGHATYVATTWPQLVQYSLVAGGFATSVTHSTQ